MATVTINGVSYSGTNVSVINGRVIIDGKEAKASEEKIVKITITGDVGELRADACHDISIYGNVKGDVRVDAGNVDCRDVGGNVNTAAGNISCGTVGGNASTMAGNISRKF